jgi:hypothetical protein
LRLGDGGGGRVFLLLGGKRGGDALALAAGERVAIAVSVLILVVALQVAF